MIEQFLAHSLRHMTQWMSIVGIEPGSCQSTVDGNDRRRKWQLSPLSLSVSKWKINFDKPEIHMCKNSIVSTD